MINRLPDPNEQPSQQDFANAKAFTENMIHEIESVLLGEIEKLEGKVPSMRQLQKHGVERFDKTTGFTHYLYKDILLVTVKPNQLKDGKRGTVLEVRQIVEPEEES